MANEVKWIKIVTDIFNDEKMYAIETLPDGFTLEVVWFKILCLAGKCNNNGFLYVSNKIAYTDEMLAKIFRMELGIVQRALAYFEELEMIEVVGNAYMVSNWLTYQDGDRLGELKEQHRVRQQKYRDRQKQLKIEGIAERDVTRDVTNDVISSISNISNSNNSSSLDSEYEKDIKDIVDYLNLKLDTNYKSKTKETRKHIIARLKDGYTFDDFKIVIDKKYQQWHNDPKMAEFLRPKTLFSPSNFESYLNQKEVTCKPKNQSFEDMWKDA